MVLYLEFNGLVVHTGPFHRSRSHQSMSSSLVRGWFDLIHFHERVLGYERHDHPLKEARYCTFHSENDGKVWKEDEAIVGISS